MKPNLTVSVLSVAFALLVGAPAAVATTVSGASQGTLTGGPPVESVGFISGTQIFSESFDVATAGTLTVKLTDIPWLAALQNLNCFVSAPGGGILGGAQNGLLDSVDIQAGTVYVNWYGQATGPLSLGVYGLNIDFQPLLPAPLPPALMLMLSGLAALAIVLRRHPLRGALATRS